MKTLADKDMGMDCPWVGKAETADELMKMAKEHVMTAHKDYWDNTASKMSEEDMKAMVEPMMKDE